MFGLRRFFAEHFSGILAAFNWIKNPDNQQKVAKEIATVLNLSQVAAPFVENIAALAAGKEGVAAVDEVVAAASKIGVKVEDFLNETDAHRKAGLALDLAGESVRQKLIALLPTIEHGLEIDGKLITSVEQLEALPSSSLQTAAQIAVRALKITDDIGALVKSTVAP